MQVGLRGMAGITGFGEQGQICQPEMGNEVPVGVQAGLMCCSQSPGKDKNAKHRQEQKTDDRQRNRGGTTHLQQLPYR